MEATTFLARALHEGQRYGDDSWVFLRELAQNARDAGACRIVVTTQTDAGRERLVFSDDGSGMNLEHARRYLFRLYASSKETDQDAAGHFGVGFWSVLRWQPETIVIESRPAAHEQPWAVVLAAQLNSVQESPCQLDHAGTRVTLDRPAASDGSLAADVRAGLRRYCRYLRRTGKGNERLVVVLNGERLDEEMSLDGPFVMRFKSRAAQGVVGLGPEPRVELYARGLLVTTKSFIEELEDRQEVPPAPQSVNGLSPVILLNSDDLDVVLSRRKPLQSRALRRLVRLGQTRVQRLVSHVIDRACPRPWPQRVRDRAQQWLRWAGGPAVLAVVILWVAALLALGTFVLLPHLPAPQKSRHRVSGPSTGLRTGPVPSRAQRLVLRGGETPDPTGVERLAANRGRTPGLGGGGSFAVGRKGIGLGEGPAPNGAQAPVVGHAGSPRHYHNISAYAGATLEIPNATSRPWALKHSGDEALLFKALTLDTFDPERGLLRGHEGPKKLYLPFAVCRPETCIRVDLTVSGPPEALLLPLPSGYRLDPKSVRVAGRSFARSLFSNRYGEAWLDLRGASSWAITTVTYLAKARREPRGPAKKNSGVSLPATWAAEVEALAPLGRQGRVKAVTRMVRRRIAYDVSPKAVTAFSTASGTWLERVWSTGAGDCDVKNAVNALILRDLGVPARLAVGIPTAGGQGLPGLHAWTEYYAQGRWLSIDATGSTSEAPAVAGLGPRLGGGRSWRQDPGDRTIPETHRRSSGRRATFAGVAERSTAGEAAQPLPGGIGSRAPQGPVPDAEPKRKTALGSLAIPGTSPTPPAGRKPASASASGAESSTGSVSTRARAKSTGAAKKNIRSANADRVAEASGSRAIPWVLTFLAAGAFALVFLWTRRRVKETIVEDTDPKDARRLKEQRALVQILLDALSQPAAWRSAAGLWHRRVLPTLRRRRLSVAEAIDRAQRGALWMSRHRSTLATAAAQGGTPVLDAGHEVFGELVVALGRGVDLDSIDALLPKAEGDGPSQALVAAANGLLKDFGIPVRCRLSPGLREVSVRDVDLSDIGLPRGSTWPRRFIAVNPRSSAVAKRAALVASNPTLGAFVWLDWLLDRSTLLADHAPTLREQAALRVIAAHGAGPAPETGPSTSLRTGPAISPGTRDE